MQRIKGIYFFKIERKKSSGRIFNELSYLYYIKLIVTDKQDNAKKEDE